jgi:anti-sigma factor RsiW
MARRIDSHVDETTVHAWLDGALSADDAARVEAHVQACDACAETVARARGMIAAASRILQALDDVPVQVVPARRRPVRWLGWPLRVAASLVLVAGGSLVVARGLLREREQVPVLPSVTVVPALPAPLPLPPPAPRLKQRVAAEPACYDVVGPAAAPVPKRIVLDTGHSALINAKAAHWTEPAPDSVEVVADSQVAVAGRVTPGGLTGTVAAAAAAPNATRQAFTARKCPR